MALLAVRERAPYKKNLMTGNKQTAPSHEYKFIFAHYFFVTISPILFAREKNPKTKNGARILRVIYFALSSAPCRMWNIRTILYYGYKCIFRSIFHSRQIITHVRKEKHVPCNAREFKNRQTFVTFDVVELNFIRANDISAYSPLFISFHVMYRERMLNFYISVSRRAIRNIVFFRNSTILNDIEIFMWNNLNFYKYNLCRWKNNRSIFYFLL